MHRKGLTLISLGLVLFALLLIQMASAQAATGQQTTPDPAVGEPELLPQPVRIKIRQSIPFTISLVPTDVLTASDAITDECGT